MEPVRLARAPIALLFALSLLAAGSARAIPAFARKYGPAALPATRSIRSSRRSVKPSAATATASRRGQRPREKETVAAGAGGEQEDLPDSVWPATVPSSCRSPSAFNGQAALTRTRTRRCRSRTGGGGTGTPRRESTTWWRRTPLARRGHERHHHDLGRAHVRLRRVGVGGARQLLFNDLIGPPHALNAVVGKGFPNPLQLRSPFVLRRRRADPRSPGYRIYGLSHNPFVLMDNRAGLEANGG